MTEEKEPSPEEREEPGEVVETVAEVAEVAGKNEKPVFQPKFDILLSDDVSSLEKGQLVRKYATSKKGSGRTDIYRFLIKEAAVYSALSEWGSSRSSRKNADKEDRPASDDFR